jgi:N-methylhydantoinase A
VAAEIREFERASTAVANAYIKPLAHRYLELMAIRLRDLRLPAPLLLMLSSGGLTHVAEAERAPVQMLESGPAAGALATAFYGSTAGYGDLLSFDMGGTTAKLCVVEGGQPLTTNEFEVDRVYRFKKGSGLPIKVPVIEMIEIGAGGGSIAHLDALGLLKVGPESAGAEPGPVCYGRAATEPTVTDADLVLGYLDPDFFLGGRMKLDQAAAERAIKERIADPLGMSVPEAAWGIHQIVNESMANAARVHAIERAKDPRSFPLFCFGGAGPVHGYRVAEILHSPAMIAPFGAGVTSTVGFLSAPLAFDFVRSAYGRLAELDWSQVNEIYAEMEADGRAVLTKSGVPAEKIEYTRIADMRYVGQGFELAVAAPDGEIAPSWLTALVEAFGVEHERTYGHRATSEPVEIVNLRLAASLDQSRVRPVHPLGDGAGLTRSERDAYFGAEHGRLATPVIGRFDLSLSERPRPGPLIVEEYDATAIVPPGAAAWLDGANNVVIEVEA